MQVFILLCFVASAFAVRECPENSHYNSCGTACPLTCENYQNPPIFCVLMCNPGCQCDEGYVKTKDGRCVLTDDCVKPEVNTCLQPADGGMCRGYFPMFHYDAKTGDCKEFIYGGCQGNDNRFSTEDECLEKCSDVRVWESSSNVCEQPIKRGNCLAYMPRYGFDKTTGQCKKFIYGGCQGNGNNFQSLEECESACGASQGALDRPDCDKDAEPGLCDAYMPRFYYDQEAGMCKKFIYGGCGGNRNNFKTEFECYNKCGALAAPSTCEQEKVVGPCKAAVPRYFYNKVTGQCEKFIYGGCSGNSNNFETQEDCEAVCTA